MAIREAAQGGSAADEGAIGDAERGDLDGHVLELAHVGAGVHDEPAADRAGNAAEKFDPAEVPAGGGVKQLAGRHASLDDDRGRPEAFQAAQGAGRDDQAANPLVADEQIRAAADGGDRDRVVGAVLEGAVQIVDRWWGEPGVGRAADAQGRVPRHRLVEAKLAGDDVREGGERTRRDSDSGGHAGGGHVRLRGCPCLRGSRRVLLAHPPPPPPGAWPAWSRPRTASRRAGCRGARRR